MIKKYQNSTGAMTRIADLVFVTTAWVAAYPIRFFWFKAIPFPSLPPFEIYLALLPLVSVLWLAGFQFFGLYRYDRVIRRSVEFYTLIRAHLGTLVVFTSLTYFITQYRFSRGVMLVFGVLVFLLCWLFRVLSRKVLRELRKKGVYGDRLVTVGESKELEHLIQQLERYPEIGVHVVRSLKVNDAEVLFQQIREADPDVVLIGVSRQHFELSDQLIQRLKDESIDIHVIPDYSEYLALGAMVESVAGVPLIQLNESPLSGYQAWVKRGFDLTFSFVGLVLLLPVFIFLALLVKLSSRGPVFYSQERMGLDGRTFKMFKFRSMKADAESKTGAIWAVPNDDRRTVVGSFLRSSSLDELPQLWNVFVGDMSLVGPRPERPVFVGKFRNEIPNYMLRHKVKTGITGWAQVSGWRGDTSLEKRIEFDLYYIRNWSLWFDLKILFLTVLKGFIHRNAY